VETINFAERLSVEFVEEGNILAPKFNKEGILPVVVTETKSGMVLMIGYMNKDALDQTILTKQGHYWSRSRKVLWKKGESSGMVHNVDDILIDDDQDSIWLKVTIEGLGASCHVGYKSCFYRSVNKIDNGEVTLNFTETEKVFDPEVVYPGADNPTKL
tara:strand:+ start:2273 stop:2746 length:474 start_codon:yes stop_codon:yes gene_type:complete